MRPMLHRTLRNQREWRETCRAGEEALHRTMPTHRRASDTLGEVRTAWLWDWGVEGELRSVVGKTAAISAYSALDTLRLRLARSMRLRLRLRPWPFTHVVHARLRSFCLLAYLSLSVATQNEISSRVIFDTGGIIQPTFFLFPFFVIWSLIP